MPETHLSPLQQAQLDDLILALGSRKKGEAETAAATLRQLGRQYGRQFSWLLVAYLLQAAMSEGLRVPRRIQIIQIVRQIGGPINLDTVVRLRDLARTYPPVFQTVWDTMMAIGPGARATAFFLGGAAPRGHSSHRSAQYAAPLSGPPDELG